MKTTKTPETAAMILKLNGGQAERTADGTWLVTDPAGSQTTKTDDELIALASWFVKEVK